jgi:outer membrane protein insertion porin family
MTRPAKLFDRTNVPRKGNLKTLRMSRFRVVTQFLLLILLLLPSALPAQQSAPQAGQPIERFEAVGNSSVASDTIRVYLGIHPGQPFDPDAIQRNFLNLWQTGLFDDIRIETDQGASGVVVRAVVQERPRVGAIEYRGNKALTVAKIGEALERSRIELHVGSTVEQTLIRRAAESIRNAYQEGGYDGVSVDVTFEEMINPIERRVVFQINEGIKARVAGIAFTGNQRFSDRRLRRTMKEVKTTNVVTRVRKRNLYVPSKLEEDLEKIRELYQDYGYTKVAFGDPEIVRLAGKKERVRIVVPVNEGQVHTFGQVAVNGNSLFTDDDIIGRWPLNEGEVLSRRPIANRIELFEELYRRRGHIYAYINPEYVDRGGNVVDVNIHVYEGEQFRLGRLEFEGNDVTKDKVLRREIFLEEGMIMDMETFKASIYKLGQLGYFKITDNPDFRVNPETHTVDVTIRGREEGKNDVQFGGGYSETYGFFGQFMFNTRNLMGEGEGLGLSFQRGQHQNFFSISYSDPWFMDRPHSLGVSVFNRNMNFPESVGFDSQGRGGSLAYGFRTGRFDSLSFVYGAEKVREHRSFTPAPDENGNIPLPTVRDQEFTTSRIIPAYRYDSRDNPYDTFRGTRMSLSLAYSGGPLGGTVNAFKPVLNFSHFYRMGRRSALSMNLEGGQIFPFNEEGCASRLSDLSEEVTRLCIPQAERFYVGGEQSIRGFRSWSIGPTEEVDGRQLNTGGHKYNVLNLEYVYRLNDPLRLVLFADAGNAYGLDEKWDPTRLRFSTGAEMRIFLPVFQFPLRFIYSFNPDRREGDRFEAFQFSVGNTF